MSSDFTLVTTIGRPFSQAVGMVRSALADQGFGIISEIDLAGTLKEKIGADMPAQVILGACRPQLAYQAIQAEPAIATVLPCNVVVRSIDENTCVVEAFDPAAMIRISDNETLRGVADDARARLAAALDSMTYPTHEMQEN